MKRPAPKTIDKPEVKPKVVKQPPLNTQPPKKMVITKNGIQMVDVRPEEPRKKDNSKYVKVLCTESSETFREIGERVGRKELKWSYYSTENSIGVHYYLILN